MDFSEVFYQSLVESLPQNFFRKDLEGRFTYANSRFCQTVGVAFEDLMGKTDFDFFPADLAAKYSADDREVMTSGNAYELIETPPSPTGEKRYVHVIKTPVRDASGRTLGIQGIFWDVTDRQVIEEQLRFERELLRTLLDTCPDAIYFKDAQSRFLRVSRWLATRFGLADPAEAIGKTDADFFTHELAHAKREDEERIIRTGEPIVQKTERADMPDGRTSWVITTKLPLRDLSGAIVGTFGVSRDVTDLMRAEADAAAARDEALDSARLKAEFLANMSHEIRTPLNAIVGMAGLLADSKLDPEHADFANTIRSSADLLLGIVNDILDFSKIEAGKLAIERVDFDLAQIVEETADLLAGPAQRKGVELVAWMPPNVSRFVRGDPGRIRQILANLVSNAVKFTDRGEVIVQVSLVSETTEDVTVRFQVRDTGIGIPPEAQARLFTAFSQADGSTTRRFGGTGLGLAISKQLVTLMQGDIGFDSVPGHGSTFWFTLTLARQTGPAADLAADTVTLEGLRVLVVDDNATNRDILHRQISAWRMRNGSASSGPEALAHLHRAASAGDPYQVVLLDMQMPDMDGLSVARAIRAEPKLRHARIVVLTSLGQPTSDAEVRRIGIAAFLTKPVKQSRLFDCLADVMRQPTELPEMTPPAPMARPYVPEAAPAVAPSPLALRVLMAEDNAVNQKVALHQLKKLGYSADAVASGREVLEAIGRTRYDIILMDCQMPDMDGYEATRRIRERERAEPGAARQYIIAITAHALDGDREKCLEAGMDDYLSKPIRLDALAKALERKI